MIKALALAALLVATPALPNSFDTAIPLPDDPKFRTAGFSCADALVRVGIIDKPRDPGPRFAFLFILGYESCEDDIFAIEPQILHGDPCVVIRFDGPEGEERAFCFLGGRGA